MKMKMNVTQVMRVAVYMLPLVSGRIKEITEDNEKVHSRMSLTGIERLEEIEILLSKLKRYGGTSACNEFILNEEETGLYVEACVYMHEGFGE